MNQKIENKIEPGSVSSKKNKKAEWKKNIKIAIAMLLVATISIVGTLAFLAANSDKKENTFTGSTGISVELTEPGWTQITNDTIVQGEEMAESYTPKMVIPKDPRLTNNSDADCDEWVAMRVEYIYDGSETNLTTLQDTVIETLAIDTTNWYKLSTVKNKTDSETETTNYDIYIYKRKVSRTTTTSGGSSTVTEGSTSNLFNQVVIKDQKALKTNSVFDSNNNKYKDFKITLYGAAIKNDASIPSNLSEINSNVREKTINMDKLSDLLTAAQAADTKDYSYIIALSLAELLKPSS